MEVTKPKSDLVVVAITDLIASCFLRFAGGAAVVSQTLVFPTMPDAVKTITHGVSANSALIEAAFAVVSGFASSKLLTKVVLRSSPYLSATALSSCETKSRKTESDPRIFFRALISSRREAFSVSSSIFENFVSLRSLSSKMYSA